MPQVYMLVCYRCPSLRPQHTNLLVISLASKQNITTFNSLPHTQTNTWPRSYSAQDHHRKGHIHFVVRFFNMLWLLKPLSSAIAPVISLFKDNLSTLAHLEREETTES